MIVGICGYKGSGKSEVAKYLVSAYGFVRFPLAKTLKDMLRTFGLSDAQVDGDEKELPCDLLGGKTPRWAMQSIGTEWGRNCIVEDIWLRAWKHNVPTDRPVIVDDVRFPNEVQMLYERGGTLWRVHRQAVVPSGAVHESEAHIHILPVQQVLDNNGDLAQLREAVDRVLAKAFASQ